MVKHLIKKVSLVIFLLITIAAFAVTFIYLFSKGDKGFLTQNFCPQQLINPTADLARLIYETETLVGIMASILVATIAFAISLWLLYWNQNIDSISDLIMYLGSQIKDRKQGGEKEINGVKTLIKDLSFAVDNIEKYGEYLTIPFYVFVILSMGIISFLIGFRFLFGRQISAYISLVGVMVVVLVLVASTIAVILLIPEAFGPKIKINIQKKLIQIVSDEFEEERKIQIKKKKEKEE